MADTIMDIPVQTDTSAEEVGVELPLDTRFTLGPEITPEQHAFLDQHGFLIFEEVISSDEVKAVLTELDEVQNKWIAQDRKMNNGVPIFWGKDEDGEPFVQRFNFLSKFSPTVDKIVHDKRFDAVKNLIGENTRVGSDERDGVVLNRFMNVPGSIYKRLGWHTDGLRDLFLLRMPGRMLNVGLHYNDIGPEDGGLRLIPGTHHQGFLKMCFGKLYFLSHKSDPEEIMVRTKAGDLTVHDGRLWHRVERSSKTGRASLRHSMYVPYLTDVPLVKNDRSRTAFYHQIGRMMRWLKGLF
jgi:phytanoyl-CoA hydroxylase